MRLAKTLTITLILSIIMITGCTEDNENINNGQAYPNIHLMFAPAATQQAEITSVILTVSGPDMEPQEFELDVDERTATGRIVVPAGKNRLFTVKAFTENNEVEFEGEKLIETLQPGTDSVLELQMEPTQLIIEIIPVEIDVSVGDTFEADIKVNHVKELFGCTFELEYDENLLEPVEEEIVKGDFLGNDALFLSEVDTGKISIGVTRKEGMNAVSGSGVLAKVKFKAVSPGTVILKIIRNEELALHRSDGTQVPRFEQLELKESNLTATGEAPEPRGEEIIWENDDAPMVLIPAGEFEMGDHFNEGQDDELPVHTVYTDAFYMDVYEVTNAQYAKFINDTGYDAPGFWDDEDSNAPEQPVVGVSWFDAEEYCKWSGKRLPTEAEWEKAARGGLVGKRYPWGDDADSSKANYDGNEGDTTPVGQYPPNGYGLYDMAGNVWEWCSDWYDPDYYSSSPREDPHGSGDGSSHVLRGGSSGINSFGIRVTGRGGYGTMPYAYFYNGFRCCVSQD